MNKLIPGARYSEREAKEHWLRARIRGENSSPEDLRRVENTWDRVAEGFRKADPRGTKLASLFWSARKAKGR